MEQKVQLAAAPQAGRSTQGAGCFSVGCTRMKRSASLVVGSLPFPNELVVPGVGFVRTC